MAQQNETASGIAGEVRSVDASDGVELQYEVVGKGPPVALLHGSFVGRSAFSRQRSALAERFSLILPSSRGHDGTDGTLPTNFGIGTSEVDDLRAVLDAEGADRAYLIGHSTGGAVAFAFAQRFSDRVRRMVLIEPTLLAILPPAEWDTASKAFAKIIDAGEAEGALAALRATMEFAGGDAWLRLDEEKQLSRLERLTPVGPLVVPHNRALLDFVVTESDLQALRPPTLLIYGSASFEFEAPIAERFRAIRPDLRQYWIEKAGHNSHREQPDLVNSAIISFFA